MTRKEQEIEARKKFAALFNKHLMDGCRPDLRSREPWTFSGLAARIRSSRLDSEPVSDRTVSNWANGRSLPVTIEPLLRVLFSDQPAHTVSKEQLRQTYQTARRLRNNVAIERANYDQVGERWIQNGEQFAKDRTSDISDAEAADDALLNQLRSVAAQYANNLKERSRRLGNSPTWSALPTAADLFSKLLSSDSSELVRNLGLLYAAALQLGRLAETDNLLRNGTLQGEAPLDSDLHGMLVDLIGISAPWLRSFPTVAKWDDKSGSQLQKTKVLSSAKIITNLVLDADIIYSEDAHELSTLLEAASYLSPSGAKAGARTIAQLWNLVLAIATLQQSFAATDTDTEDRRSVLLGKSLSVLKNNRKEIEALTSGKPADLRAAIGAMLKADETESNYIGRNELVPDDFEQVAVKIFIENGQIPQHWQPLIQRLDFEATLIEKFSLSALPQLPQLKELIFTHTTISNLKEISRFKNLEMLELFDCGITSISPIKSLKYLDHITLWDNNITNYSFLGTMKRLTYLDLARTGVKDIEFLLNLSSITHLYISGNNITDIRPLQNMIDIEYLWIDDNPISDFQVLSRFSKLRSLRAGNTKLQDISSLLNLDHLTALEISNNNIYDLPPMKCEKLEQLIIANTKISEIRNISNLKSIKNLDLRNTQIEDLSVLSKLTHIEKLNLSGTRVVDLRPLSSLSNLKELILPSNGKRLLGYRPEWEAFTL